MAPMLRLAALMGGATTLMLGLMALGCGRSSDNAGGAADAVGAPSRPPVKLGLWINEPKAFQGYTLIAPVRSRKTFLIDMQGRVVRMWESDCTPALGAYLLDNGHLLRTGALKGAANAEAPGAGGLIQEFTWEGELVWDFKFSTEKLLPHHDITRLPNGNVLMIVTDRKTDKEAIAAGRRPDLMQTKYFFPDCLIEIKPTGKTTGDVVWEWHLWDHLVQENNPSRKNYGKVAEHPELVDVNYYHGTLSGLVSNKASMDKLRSIGYVGDNASSHSPWLTGNWSHLNGVVYDAELDQIMVTSFSFSEFWIIDHSTTKAEAAGHSGGRSGKGGDLLYRWGNPGAYRPAVEDQQRLFAAHSAHWIPRGLPGAGNVLVFNNGWNRPGGSYSSVEELAPPTHGKSGYPPPSETGPDQPLWSYNAPNKPDLYSVLLSGAQRLPNGNTLICSGSNGTLLEVTPEKEVVWKYINPTRGGFVPSKFYPTGSEGFGPRGGGSLFRAYRYAPDYAGLVGRDVTPGETVEALLKKQADEKSTREVPAQP